MALSLLREFILKLKKLKADDKKESKLKFP